MEPIEAFPDDIAKPYRTTRRAEIVSRPDSETHVAWIEPGTELLVVPHSIRGKTRTWHQLKNRAQWYNLFVSDEAFQ